MDEHDAESAERFSGQYHASNEGGHDAKSGVRTATCRQLLQIKATLMPKRIKQLSDAIMVHVKGRA
jgi:hypothetical protein